MLGAKGNKKAIIASSSIQTPQIRIANIIKELEKDEIDKQFSIGYIEDDKFILK